MEGTHATYWDGYEDDLLKKLLDSESPFDVLPTEDFAPELNASDKYTNNQLLSNLYSGPTIKDIENALSMTIPKVQSNYLSRTREADFSKAEHKSTVKIKSRGNSMADDGYKWRKYGQKTIKNSQNLRSYYRCTNPRCSSKKQVEMSKEDPDTLIITYEGLHLHFSYPYFVLNQPQSVKKTNSRAQEEPQRAEQGLIYAGDSCMHDMEQEEPTRSQGLLEDVVPFTVRNPANKLSISNSSSSSSFSNPTPHSPYCSPNFTIPHL